MGSTFPPFFCEAEQKQEKRGRGGEGGNCAFRPCACFVSSVQCVVCLFVRRSTPLQLAVGLTLLVSHPRSPFLDSYVIAGAPKQMLRLGFFSMSPHRFTRRRCAAGGPQGQPHTNRMIKSRSRQGSSRK
eukprot:scaffold160554_cov24-Tisochrysis_lutea.AAC.1